MQESADSRKLDPDLEAMGGDTPIGSNSDQDWRVLRIYNTYQILLASVLLALYVARYLAQLRDTRFLDFIGSLNPQLFFNAAILYLAVTIAARLIIHAGRFSRNAIAFSVVAIDTLAITAMMHASGGIQSGLGNLLLVAIAAGNIMIQGRTGLTLAALASLALIYENLLLSLSVRSADQASLQTGLLGLILFAIAVFVQTLVVRIRRTEAIAQQRAVDIAKLEELNDLIIQRMQTGVIAVDESNQVLTINTAARHLLGYPTDQPDAEITLLPMLANQMDEWKLNPKQHQPPIRPRERAHLVQTGFHGIGGGHDSSVLIYLEDATRMTQQAQQLKLASLGRLTAGIAHEIRNPLGAVSNAAQLLAESDSLTSGDQRLIRIIEDNALRMNRIIENVLQLSRRKVGVPGHILLRPWVKGIVEAYVRETDNEAEIEVDIEPGDLEAEVDPTQIHQVLTNLIDNGLRYSRKHSANNRMKIIGRTHAELRLPYLDFVDQGPGIAREQLDKVFEPFFTTESTGTGLGLFISRELCEANHALLEYIDIPEGSCFRIIFANPN